MSTSEKFGVYLWKAWVKMSSKVEILDCTLRDGSYPINYFYSLEDTKRISEVLERGGVEKIEVGHGMGLGAAQKGYGKSAYSDFQYIEAAVSAVNSSSIGVFAIPGVAEAQHVIDAKKAGITFLRIGTDVDKIESARELVELGFSLGLSVSLNVMKSYARPKAELLEAILSLGVSSLDVISIVDSAGTMIPADVQEYVSYLVENLQNKIGFHGHNNLQLAIANSIAAVQGGASVIDATLRGIGRSSGNAQIEVLVPVLERAGYLTRINHQALSDFSDLFYESPYPDYGIQGIELACGVFGLHSSFLPKVVTEANSMGIDIVELISEVTKNDRINLTPKNLKEASRIVSQKRHTVPVAAIPDSEVIQSLDDLLNSLITYAIKFNKKSILTLSPSGNNLNRFPRLTNYEDYIIGHAEVADIETKLFTPDKFKELDYLGIDRKLLQLDLDLNPENLFIYDENQIIDLLISEMVLNFKLLRGEFYFQAIGERDLGGVKEMGTQKRESNSEHKTITFVTSKLSKPEQDELNRINTSKVIFLHPEYIPDDFYRDSEVEVYRLDTRSFFDLHVISIARSARDFAVAKFLNLGGVKTVAGGLVANRGTIVVDNPNNPKRILGVASGFGTLLSKNDENEFESEIRKVSSFLLESNLRFLRSGD